jgi:two-component system chemotaxis response regulator CheB
MSKSEPRTEEATVLVVDDSVFMRRMVSDIIGRFPGFRVVGVAVDGNEALRSIERLDPDVVTLDIEMPRLDGFGVLQRVMSSRPRPVVMLSGYTGANAALRALELGAVEFVAKPSGPISFDVAKVEAQLFEALSAAIAADLQALVRERASTAQRRPPRSRVVTREAAVAIAASTGGPRALTYVLGSLPADLGAAVLIVQHMPPGFTTTLASRLDDVSPIPVAEASGGEAVVPNRALLAPGDFHMRVRCVDGAVRVALDQRELLCGTRPAADALFPSVAEAYGERCVGVVLTGMGRDGTTGLAAVKAAGGGTLAQDRASSVVYGMPGRAMEEGVAQRAVALDAIPDAIVECLDSLESLPAEGLT